MLLLSLGERVCQTCYVVICLRYLIGCVTAADGIIRHEIIEERLTNYSRDILPNFDTEDPVNVKVKVIIHSMDSISEATMDYSVTIYLRLWWHDPRLVYNDTNFTKSLQLNTETMKRIWVPDVFFVNEKRGNFHYVTVPNKLMHIQPNGTVFYSMRLSLTLTCGMDLRKYPLDSQICPMIIESYSFTADNVRLFWMPDKPIDKKEGLQLPHFEMTDVKSTDCTKVIDDLGNFTCIRGDIYVKRIIGYYIVQVYVPSFLIVVLSWVSFWLNIDAIPARISVGVLTVLTITTQTSGISATLPKVSYVKAIDIWMAMCLSFVFGAVLEFSVVNVFARGEWVKVNVDFRSTIRTLVHAMPKDANTERQNHIEETKPIREAEDMRKKCDYIDRRRADRVDKFSRKAFPCAFIMLNIVYWIFFSIWEPL